MSENSEPDLYAEDRYVMTIAGDHAGVRLDDTVTGDVHSFTGSKALYDALGVLAEWRDRDRLRPTQWCHCQGSSPTRLHPIGTPGCTSALTKIAADRADKGDPR
jgi:hypothetical protein